MDLIIEPIIEPIEESPDKIMQDLKEIMELFNNKSYEIESRIETIKSDLEYETFEIDNLPININNCEEKQQLALNTFLNKYTIDPQSLTVGIFTDCLNKYIAQHKLIDTESSKVTLTPLLKDIFSFDASKCRVSYNILLGAIVKLFS